MRERKALERKEGGVGSFNKGGSRTRTVRRFECSVGVSSGEVAVSEKVVKKEKEKGRKGLKQRRPEEEAVAGKRRRRDATRRLLESR